MTQPQDKMRAEFELWGEHSFYSGMDSPELDWSDESNSYKTLAHHMAFCAWQAACAQQSAQSQQDARDAARNPLTDEQINHIQETHVGGPTPSYPLDPSDWLNFARAIEHAHGISAIAAQGASNV